MSKTETQNKTTFTAAELAYRDQLVMAAMQGDWASQSPELGEFTASTTVAHAMDRAKDYFRFAEAVLLERRKHGLPEEQIEELTIGSLSPVTKEDVVKGGSDWDKIPGGGSVVQPLAGYGITDGQPAASPKDPRPQDRRDRPLDDADFPHGTLIRMPGDHRVSFDAHSKVRLFGREFEIVSYARWLVLRGTRRGDVILSHDFGKTWS